MYFVTYVLYKNKSLRISNILFFLFLFADGQIEVSSSIGGLIRGFHPYLFCRCRKSRPSWTSLQKELKLETNCIPNRLTRRPKVLF